MRRNVESKALKAAQTIGEAKQAYERTTEVFAWIGVAAGLFSVWTLLQKKKEEPNGER